MRTEQPLQTTLMSEVNSEPEVDLSQSQSKTDNEKLLFSVKKAIYSDLALSLQKLQKGCEKLQYTVSHKQT